MTDINVNIAKEQLTVSVLVNTESEAVALEEAITAVTEKYGEREIRSAEFSTPQPNGSVHVVLETARGCK